MEGEGGKEEFQYVVHILQKALNSGDYRHVQALDGTKAQRAQIIAQAVRLRIMLGSLTD